MSARALLGAGGRTKLIEIDMPYHEREGVSKLNVVKDGLRFFRIITETAFLYQPGRMLNQLAALFFLIAVLIGLTAASSSIHRTAEWSFSQPILGAASFLFALLLFSTSSSVQQIADLTFEGEKESAPFSYGVHRIYTSRLFWIVPFALVLNGWAHIPVNLLTNEVQYAPAKRPSQELWTGFLFLTAVVLVAGRIFAYFVDLLRKQVDYTRHANDRTKHGRVI